MASLALRMIYNTANFILESAATGAARAVSGYIYAKFADLPPIKLLRLSPFGKLLKLL